MLFSQVPGEIDLTVFLQRRGDDPTISWRANPVAAQTSNAFIRQVDRLFEEYGRSRFIAFSLLAHGLCRSPCLAGLHPATVADWCETPRRNGPDRHVTVNRADGPIAIPTSERWQLVVDNPPHAGTDQLRP